MWRLSLLLLLNVILATLFLPDDSFAAEMITSKNITASITDGFHTDNLEVPNKDILTIASESTRHPDGREGVPRSYTEGGSVSVKNSVTKTVNVTNDSASKRNDNLLAPLLAFSNHSTASSIQARKGVGNNTQSSEEAQDASIPVVQQKIDSMGPNMTKTVSSTTKELKENRTIPIKPKKPTVTAGADDQYMPSHFNVPVAKPSSKPATSTTVGSTNKAVVKSEEPHEDEGKHQLDSPSGVMSVERIGKGYVNPLIDGHPGFILPVVITILVVPMFGLLGYLALRRGREAWKNRHYRRMDFLLDGMYND